MGHYGILLIGVGSGYHAIIAALLEPLGGTVDCAATPDAAIAAAGATRYDLVLIDLEQDGGEEGRVTLSRLRTAAEWLRLVPMIAFTTLAPDGGEGHFRGQGFDGYLRKPFTAAEAVGKLQRWLGDGVSLPAGGDDRLAALIGRDEAEHMVARLHQSMADAIAAIDGGADPASFGHRLGGLAGTLGFPVLSAAWLAVQDGDSASWPTVRALSREAIARD